MVVVDIFRKKYVECSASRDIPLVRLYGALADSQASDLTV